MFGFDEHYSINVSHYENEEELDHKLKKHIRQLEGEHKIQRAVQEQKIELLEMKLREFEEREAGLKKMNSEILVTLGDLNKKEDSALMNKVFEELAIANKEKLREKKQQQTKFQALKSQLELTISELKGKLAQSDREKKEMELEYKEKILMYEDELEQDRKAHEALKREFEEKRGHVKGNEEMQRLKKRIAVLEEENNGLKKEFEKETGRMKFQFERNLADLKEIHGEERSSFEARLKKTKEQLVKAEEESDDKAAAERELMREVASLREKIIEMEINSIGEIDRITNEKDAALEKVKVLEKCLDELKKNYEKEQKEQNNACNISSAELFAQNLEERLRHLEEKEQKETMSFKTPNTKAESKNTLCEQASVDHLPVFTNLESQMPSLASSMVHEHFVTEKKKAMAAIANQPIIGPDFSRCWTHEDLMKMVYSKPNTRSNSRHDLNYVSQPQTPKCHHTEVDHHRKSIIKSVCAHSEKPENLITPENKVYMEKEPQCSCQISGHQFREWALKDTSYAKNNCADPTHVRRQSRVSEDEYGVSYRNDSHIGTEPWNYDKAVPKRAERVQNSFRGAVNYSDKVYMKNEGPMLRRNGSNGMVENSIRRDFSNDKFDDHCNMSVMMKDDEGQIYDPNRKLFRDGIHEVMTGLRNIKTRLEKQQEDIMVAKNVSINCEINKRARSISNVKVRPNVMPRDVLNQNSFYIEGNYRGNEQSRGYLGRLDMNRSAYVTDENSISMHNASQYGDNKKYIAESLQASYRGRTPVLMRENNRAPFLSRHRNSLV